VAASNRVCHPSAPSIDRSSQPVVLLAQGLAKRLGVSIYVDAMRKIEKTPSMKNVDDCMSGKDSRKAIQIGKDDVTESRYSCWMT